MPTLLLDCLPVELFHETLSYLSGSHILKAFYFINNYLNDILTGYNHYILDLSASDIGKNEFDLIFSFLRSEQIVGLHLGQHPFDLANRFLSNFANRQPLTHLRSLWIDGTIVVDRSFLTRLTSTIDLNILLSIRFDRIHQTDIDLSDSYNFDSLTHLTLRSSNQYCSLSKWAPTHLTYLHMFFDSIVHMDILIRANMHQLKSLGIGIHCDSNNIQEFTNAFSNYQWTQLIQFNLNLSGNMNVSFEIMHRILSEMHRLRYLTLILSEPLAIHNDVLDGTQWESFLSTSLISLKTFNLKFVIMHSWCGPLDDLLIRFRSEWWISTKQWFIEYDFGLKALITVPYFATKITDTDHFYTVNSMHNPKIFYSNIESLEIDLQKYDRCAKMFMSQSLTQPCFNHLTRLSLNGSFTTELSARIQEHVDLQMVKYFQFTSQV
ncbi:unnamed protein product, partial [Adineta steineri]